MPTPPAMPTPPVAPAPAPAPPAQEEHVDDATVAVSDLDRTVVVSRQKMQSWVLELSDGSVFSLSGDTVVGRKPEPIEGSAVLAVPDVTRTLSKSHARLTSDGERWLIEDLGSTNGLVLLREDGSESEITPGVRVEATERMLFGTLEVRLRSGGDAA